MGYTGTGLERSPIFFFPPLPCTHSFEAAKAPSTAAESLCPQSSETGRSRNESPLNCRGSNSNRVKITLVLFSFHRVCLRVHVYVSVDHQVKTLNRRVVELMGFDKWIPVSGQTYSRKIDYQARASSVFFFEVFNVMRVCRACTAGFPASSRCCFF